MSLYRFLEDAFVNGRYYQAGTTAATADVGGTLPAGWVPNGNVDPLNVAALADFFNAGPQPLGLVRQQFDGLPVPLPATYWGGPPGNPFLQQRTNPPEFFIFGTGFTQGAVQLFGGAYITGSGSVVSTFNCGVLSSWININDAFLSNANQDYSRIYQPGPNAVQSDLAKILTVDQSIVIAPGFLSNGNISLAVCDVGSGLAMTDIEVTMGPPNGAQGAPDGRIGGWHHCIWSWNSAQLVQIDIPEQQTIRVQFAWDRGGTPFQGAPGQFGRGGIYDSALGVDHHGWPYPSPQPMPQYMPDCLQGNSGQAAVTNRFHEWQIMNALPNCNIGYAYCFFGISNSFYDLTIPANLNRFVTPNLEATNLTQTLGPGSGSPLTPVWQHTGGAIDPLTTGSSAPLFYYNNVDGLQWDVSSGIFDASPGPPLGSI